MSRRVAALYNRSHEVFVIANRRLPTRAKNRTNDDAAGSKNAGVNLENDMTETSRKLLKNQLAHVIAFNLLCLGLFVALCVAMTFGSLDMLLTYWNEHRAASMVVSMAAILSIPSIVEATVSRLR
jgi:hypothetical protein